MSLKAVVFLLLISLWMPQCEPPRPVFVPETVELSELATAERNPRRAASIRLVEKGQEELSRSHFARAARHFTSAIEVDAKNPFAYFYLGLLRFKTTRYKESSEFFHRAANLFTDSNIWKAESFAYRGESLEKLKRFDEAKNAYIESVAIYSQNDRANKGLSRISE